MFRFRIKSNSFFIEENINTAIMMSNSNQTYGPEPYSTYRKFFNEVNHVTNTYPGKLINKNFLNF